MSPALIEFLVAKGIEAALTIYRLLEENKAEDEELNSFTVEELIARVKAIDVGDSGQEFQDGVDSLDEFPV